MMRDGNGMRYVLDDVKVLDFSHALAGPYCTLLLAAYGARVFKLEPPGTGEIARHWGPPFTGKEASFFLGLNSNKLGISIDLKTPAGRDLCLRLAEKVDVLVENFRPGSPARLGLSYEHVRARNPRLIYCSISGYGQNGPSRDLPAMDLIMQAASGLLSITGSENGRVARCGHSVADITAGMFAAVGILLALHARERSGQGQFIDVSMFDGMISAMCSNFSYFLGSGDIPSPMGTAFKTIVPYRTFATADRDIALAAGSDKLWTSFCEAIGAPHLADDPRYTTNPQRVQNRHILEPLLAKIFRQAPCAEWLSRLSRAGVPCSPVRTFEEVWADPQSSARQMFPALSHSSAGNVTVTGLPVKLSATPGRIRFAAPRRGQHTRAILRSLLCMDDAALDRLESEGVIAGDGKACKSARPGKLRRSRGEAGKNNHSTLRCPEAPDTQSI
jgi:crotonobetainyl-CoA:carnitine CoA-transferase CaiB-like acyl-CoA transferase